MMCIFTNEFILSLRMRDTVYQLDPSSSTGQHMNGLNCQKQPGILDVSGFGKTEIFGCVFLEILRKTLKMSGTLTLEIQTFTLLCHCL